MRKLSIGTFSAPADIRLLITTGKLSIRLFEHERFVRLTADVHGHVEALKPERGSILEIFSEIEFIINELIKFDIMGIPNRNTDWTARKIFEDAILTNIDLKNKIKILQSRGLFDNKLSSKLFELKEVRNRYAHFWIESRITYKGKPVEAATNSSFEEFKNDIIDVWKNLFEIYKVKQDAINLREFITFTST